MRPPAEKVKSAQCCGPVQRLFLGACGGIHRVPAPVDAEQAFFTKNLIACAMRFFVELET